jgi:hypothetical protein
MTVNNNIMRRIFLLINVINSVFEFIPDLPIFTHIIENFVFSRLINLLIGSLNQKNYITAVGGKSESAEDRHALPNKGAGKPGR